MSSRKILFVILALNLATLSIVAVLLLHPVSPSTAANPALAKINPPPTAHGSNSTAEDTFAPRSREDTVTPVSEAASTPAETEDQTAGTTDNTAEVTNYNLLPIAMIDPDSADKSWTPEQLQILGQLRRELTEAMKPLQGMDSSSPEYLAKWQSIQDDFDNQYRARLGIEQYVKYRDRLLHLQAQAGAGN